MNENSNLTPKIRFKGFTDAWEQRKLGDIYKFQYGEFNNNPSNGGKYPVYGANGIIGGYTNYNTESSVIIGHMGEYAGSVLWGEGKHFVTYNGAISKPKSDLINNKFGYYMLFHKDINKICGGSGLPFLSYEQLNKIDVSYPKDKKEQIAISNYLTNIDNLITLHQRKYDKLVKIKSSLLEKMFPKNFSNIPEVRFKGFTDAWEQRKLEEMCQITMGQSPDGSTYSETPSDFILVQGNADLKDGWVFPRIWTTQKAKTADAGDLIMSVRAPAGAMGKTAYNVVLGRGVAGIKGNEFIYQSLVKMDSDGYWKKLAAGSTFESINSDVVNGAELIIPQDIEEQIQIGSFFANLDNLITLHQRKLDKLQNIKKSLLEKMFV